MIPHCHTHPSTLALHSSQVTTAVACSPSQTCLTSSAAAGLRCHIERLNQAIYGFPFRFASFQFQPRATKLNKENYVSVKWSVTYCLRTEKEYTYM